MFEDSLLESGKRFKTKRGATTALSVVLQSLLLGGLVLVPLIYTEALPELQSLGPLPLPPAPVSPHHDASPTRPMRPVVSELRDGRVIAPIGFRDHALKIEDPEPAIGNGNDPVGVIGSPGPSDPNNRLLQILAPQPVAAPTPPRTERLQMSGGVTAGHLIRRVEPVYPPLAIPSRIEGDVVIRAVIGRDGGIENLTVVSGHPFLIRAAMDAVRQWQYQPFLLSGRPVEVDTQITVRFRLSKN